MKKRILSFLICMVLLLGVIPVGSVTMVSAYSEEESYAFWSNENNGERHSGKPATGGYAYYDRGTNTLEIKDFVYRYDYPENTGYVMFNIPYDGLTVNLIGNNTVNITGKRAVIFVSCLGTCEITSAKEASLSVTATGDTDTWTICFYCKNRISYDSNVFFDPELIISGKATVNLFAVSVNTDEEFRHAVAVDADQVTLKDSAQVFLYGSHQAGVDSKGLSATVLVDVEYDPLVKTGSTAENATERTLIGKQTWTWNSYLSVTPAPPKPPEPIPITSVTVYRFESPVAGATAGSRSNLYIPTGTHYSFDSAQRNGGYSFWRNTSLVSLRDSATFASGAAYYECAFLIAEDGYYFADNCKFYAYDNYGNAVPLSKKDTYVSDKDNTHAYIYAASMEVSPTAYNVWVNGKRVTPSNQDNILGDSGTPSAAFLPRSNTLTLNGYNGGYIKAEIPLNIVLADGSQNRITVSADTEECGIYCEGDLSISGGGSLTVETKPQYCEAMCNLGGDLTVDMSGDLTVNSAMRGIMSGDGYVRMSGSGNVNITAGTEGISSHFHTIFENEASVTVNAGRNAVNMFDGMLLLDGIGTPISLTSGKGYAAVHQSVANDYLVFSSSVHMYYVAVEGAPEESHVVYNFVKEEQFLHAVTVCGLSVPIAGNTPRTQNGLYVPAGEHCSFSVTEGMNAEWVDGDNNALGFDEAFVENEVYAQVFYLVTDAGYRFAEDCTFTLIGEDGQQKPPMMAIPVPGEPYYAMIAASFEKAVSQTAGFTVSGTIANNTEKKKTDITLTQQSNTGFAYRKSVEGDATTYAVSGVAAGTYTMTVSQADRVLREYTVVVKGNTTLNIDLSLTCLYGDVDGDGSVNAADALLILKSAVNKITLSAEQKTAADVNGDTKIDASDALLVLKKAVKKIQKFPVEA